MNNLPIAKLMLALLTVAFLSACQDSPEDEEPFFLQEEESPLISIEATNITNETIEVKAVLHSTGIFTEAKGVKYGFVWFKSDFPINMDDVPEENKVFMGTLEGGSSFTFRTTLSDLNTATSYNVCTFLSDEAQMMFGEEIMVETL